MIRRAADPVSAAAITTVTGAACALVVSRVDLAVGPFLGPNQAVLGRTRPNPGHFPARPFILICRHFGAQKPHERHASHARGRRFETRRAHTPNSLQISRFLQPRRVLIAGPGRGKLRRWANRGSRGPASITGCSNSRALAGAPSLPGA